LCGNLTFIGHLCEICSMYENTSVSEVCAVSEVLCSVSDGHYTKSGNCSIFDEEKGRRVLDLRLLHRRKRETHDGGARLPFY
jgi:hypothetical protein